MGLPLSHTSNSMLALFSDLSPSKGFKEADNVLKRGFFLEAFFFPLRRPWGGCWYLTSVNTTTVVKQGLCCWDGNTSFLSSYGNSIISSYSWPSSRNLA